MKKIGKAIAVLFIGNSYTNRNDLPGLLERLAAAGKPSRTLNTKRVIANGMSLKTHWDRGIATNLIRSRRWNFVVLQDQSTMGLKNPGRLKEYAVKFSEECRANSATTALYMTWSKQDAPKRQVEITTAYQDAARAADALIIPVGLAWQKVRQLHPNVVLYDRDKSHPSAVGTYLAACVFYSTLLRQSPIGLPADGLSANDAARFQAIAFETSSDPGE